MLDKLRWRNIPDAAAYRLALLLLSEWGESDLDLLVFEAAEAKLPFYENYRLYRLDCTDREDGFAASCYALWDVQSVVFPINGTSTPLHAVNEYAPLMLSQDVADDYIRFFLFCVRGAQGAFVLVESLPDQDVPGAEIIAPHVAPLEYLGQNGVGRYQYKATIGFRDTLFSSVFLVSKNGAIEMTDDTPLVGNVSEATIPAMPSLNGVQLITEHLSKIVFETNSSAPVAEPGEKNNSMALLKNIYTIREQLNDCVLEQGDAVEAVCDALLQQIYRSNENAPAGVFLFVGPPATGKTLLAEKLAELLGTGWGKYAVNMANLTSDNQGFALNGLSKGYATARSGDLTSFVRENPRSVIIIENIDKPHPNNLAVFEPILSNGYLKDEFGFYEDNDSTKRQIAPPEVSFRETIVIFTTNAGADAYEDPGFQKLIKKNPAQIESLILNELGNLASWDDKIPKQFSASILAGLATGNTVLFKKLSLNALSTIAGRKIKSATDKISAELGCTINIGQPALLSSALVLSFAPEVDARTVNNELVQRLLDPLLDYAREQQGVVPGCVNIRFVADAQCQLEEILAKFGGYDPLEQMFRKNQTLHLKVHAFEQDGALIIELGEIELQRVPHAKDFRGAGAIRAEIPNVSFQNIAGHHVVKKRMAEVVKLLKNPDAIKAMGVDAPKGMLMFGPPGTGKTMLAKALAHEADLPFISTTGSEVLNPDFIRAIFKRARKYAPSILFIDEFDAIGTRGYGGIDIIINQLLTEIDGFDTSLSAPVFIIAATNLPDKIDPALVRSGRIDLKVEVPALDRDARAYFVDEYFKLPHDDSLDRNLLLNYTAGMSGADLEMVKRETVLEMVSSSIAKINMQMLAEHINTIKYGVRSGNPKLLQTIDSTAYHEAGHAIVSMVVNPDVLIEQVTVMPREGALGFVSYDVESAQYRQINRQEVLDTMCVSLAGRIAQTRQFPDHGDDSGASSDLQKATAWATYAITKLGLDEKLGNMVLPVEKEHFSPAAGDMVFERVQVWLKEAEEICRRIIEKNWGSIDALAKRLLKDEVITGDELRRDFSSVVGSAGDHGGLH